MWRFAVFLCDIDAGVPSAVCRWERWITALIC